MKKEKFLIIFILLLAAFLRLFGQNISPPGFTSDEAAFAYNAYSLLKTGKDQYGEIFPLAFRAFGDWRPPLYVYLTAPFVKIFGMRIFAARAVSIISGILMAYLTYLLGKKIFGPLVGLLSALFLAFSPWHLLITRYADMAPLSALFLTTGIYFFLDWYKREKREFLIYSALAFVFATYSYHNTRITGPIILIFLTLISYKKILKKKEQFLKVSFTAAIFLLPLILVFLKTPYKMLRRGAHESIFKQGTIAIKLWNDITVDPSSQPPLITRFFHNKLFYYLYAIAEQYTSHLNFRYLFVEGDIYDRFNLPINGLVFSGLLPFLILGIFFIIKSGNKFSLLLLFWLLASPIIASIGRFVPNSLHTFDSVIPLHLIIVFGIVSLYQKINYKNGRIFLTFCLILIFLAGIFNLVKGYFFVLTKDKKLLRHWNYGKKQLVDKVALWEKRYPEVVFVGGHYDIDLLFFKNYPPENFQKEFKLGPVDKNGFQSIESFANYSFIKPDDKKLKLEPDILYIDDVSNSQYINELAAEQKLVLKEIETIYFPDNSPAFRLFVVEEIQ